MKIRAVLLLLSLLLSLITGADRLPDTCQNSWTPNLNLSKSPTGTGVNIHFTDPRPGEIKMIAGAGFRWVRMDFKWDLTETERSRYDFSPYERLMAALEQHGIRALFILDYGNPLYDNGAPPRTKATQQAFARWAVAAAKHFSGRGVIWEIYNEPNIELFWPPKPNADEYIALALAVGRAFRDVVPNEKLIGPAVSGMDLDFLEACFKAGLLDYWSAVSVHPYFRGDPEVAAAAYCRLRELIARYRGPERSGDIPIISGEWGYSSVWRGMSEDTQAQMLTREFLTNAANGIPLSIWYDWQDDGADPGEAEHHFGLVRHTYGEGQQPYQPKPAYLAARTANTFLTAYNFEKRLPVGSSDDFVVVFSKNGERRVACWTTLSRPHQITIPLEAGSYSITKHTGEEAGSVTAREGGALVEVSRAPVYLARRN